MRHLLICGEPGDEVLLYGHLVATTPAGDFSALLVSPSPLNGERSFEAEDRWRHSCRAMGVMPLGSLRSPIPLALASSQRTESAAARIAQFPPEELLGPMRPLLARADRVYVPSIEDPCPARSVAAAALSALSPTLWMATPHGPGDQVVALTTAQFQMLSEWLSDHYAEHLRISRIRVSDLSGVQQYRRMEGAQVRRFAIQFLGGDFAGVREEDPWDFVQSPYERRRHALECRALHDFDWTTLVEIGACQGALTRRLITEFPGRQITCIEPNAPFLEALRREFGEVVRVEGIGLADLRGHFDVVLASSVLYYLDAFPLSLLDAARMYFVSSHLKTYHDTVVTPIMTLRGWTAVARHALSPRIEMFCGIPVLKDGTEVIVWRRPLEGADNV